MGLWRFKTELLCFLFVGACLAAGGAAAEPRAFESYFDALPVFWDEVYPDGGHAISDPATGRVQEAFLDDLVAFIRGATGAG